MLTHLSEIVTPERLDVTCLICKRRVTAPNKVLGRAVIATFRSNHQHSPAITTRDVTAGGSTSSVCHGDTVPEPVGRLGDVVTLDDLLPGGVS